MKVKDEAEWQLFLAELAADDDPRAEAFRDFLVAWTEAAEVAMEPERDVYGANDPPSPVEALRRRLRSTEAELGRWTVGYLGLMLVVLGTHWAPAGNPDDFVSSLTPIEQNLYFDALAIKQEQLDKLAADTPAGGEG